MVSNKNIKKEIIKNVFRKSEKIHGKIIQGYDFEKGIDYGKLLDSYENIGFQATNFNKAIRIIKEMKKNNSYIYLGYTSNLVSSGLRECFSYLAKNKLINVIVTTAGGIEEDFIKCLGDFRLGSFDSDGKNLRNKGINRIGNIFAPNNEYVKFEKFLQPILKEFYEQQKKTGKIIKPLDIIWKLGEKINNEKSIYYQAWKNKIPVYCPCISDGALGDNLYFFSLNNPDFKIDFLSDLKWFNNTSFGKKKTGVIILGAGIIKHSILNVNMLRNGADYAVYINTEQDYNGSDSGAHPDEAVSWGKIKGEKVKVFADATLVFPLIMAKSFF